jgi:hypothetical protein
MFVVLKIIVAIYERAGMLKLARKICPSFSSSENSF